GERLAAQQIATEAVRHRQRIAVPSVASAELPFVVRTPDIIGREDRARRLAGMADAAPVTFDRHQPMPLQDVARRRAAWQQPSGLALVQERQQFLAAPGWVPAPSVQDRGHDLVGRLIWRASRTPRALLQARGPVAQVPVDPLI